MFFRTSGHFYLLQVREKSTILHENIRDGAFKLDLQEAKSQKTSLKIGREDEFEMENFITLNLQNHMLLVFQ